MITRIEEKPVIITSEFAIHMRSIFLTLLNALRESTGKSERFSVRTTNENSKVRYSIFTKGAKGSIVATITGKVYSTEMRNLAKELNARWINVDLTSKEIDYRSQYIIYMPTFQSLILTNEFILSIYWRSVTT